MCVNCCMLSPTCLKTKTTVIHKADRPIDLVGNFKPLNPSSCFSKFLGKSVVALYYWTNRDQVFNKKQKGFS